MTLTKRGFTLVELLVVIAMISIILGAMASAASGAMERARVQKAKSEVKIIAQAILAYENETKNGSDYELPTMDKAVCNSQTMGFLLGKETGESGKIPVLLMAALSGGGELRDPWNHPYRVTIKKNQVPMEFQTLRSLPAVAYAMPNAHRVQKEEK